MFWWWWGWLWRWCCCCCCCCHYYFLFSSRSSLLSKKQPTPFPAKRENKQWSQAPVPSSHQSEARRMLTHVPPSLLQTLPSSHTPAPLSSPLTPPSSHLPPPFFPLPPLHSLSPSRVKKKGESIPKSCTEHSAVRSWQQGTSLQKPHFRLRRGGKCTGKTKSNQGWIRCGTSTVSIFSLLGGGWRVTRI